MKKQLILPAFAVAFALASCGLSAYSVYVARYAQDVLKCEAIWQQRFALASQLPKVRDRHDAQLMAAQIKQAIPSPHYGGKDICDY
ncbi:hypothetical protein HZC00_03800 [Candidatus Kaiserbacteria bacterium]|nr:hypothetical protein [Candidatus Kaiserbacteria bacterium]